MAIARPSRPASTSSSDRRGRARVASLLAAAMLAGALLHGLRFGRADPPHLDAASKPEASGAIAVEPTQRGRPARAVAGTPAVAGTQAHAGADPAARVADGTPVELSTRAVAARDAEQRADAVAALGDLSAEELLRGGAAVEAMQLATLRAALGDADAPVQAEAIRALGRAGRTAAGRDAATQALRHALGGPDPRLRLLTVETLAGLRGDVARDALMLATRDPDSEVRETARERLAEARRDDLTNVPSLSPAARH